MELKPTVKRVLLHGIKPIMFDRYPGDNDTKLSVEEKMYFDKDGKSVCIPSENIIQMLSSNGYRCAAKIKYGRKWKDKADAIQGFVDFDSLSLSFSRNGKSIKFDDFGKDGFEAITAVGRVKKTGGGQVPNPTVRPILHPPWSLSFKLTILPNDVIKEGEVLELMEIGGLYVGIGTWRPKYGKFLVDKWE